MKFKIPDIALTDLAPAAITRLRDEAAAEYGTMLATAKERGTATSAELDEMESLLAFVGQADATLGTTDGTASEPADGAGEDNASRLDALAPLETPAEVVESTDEESVAALAAKKLVSKETATVVENIVARSSITASAPFPGVSAGQELDGLGAVAQIISAQVDGMAGVRINGRQQNPVAAITLPPSEFTVYGDRRDEEVIAKAVSEERFPGGSLAQARYAAFKEGAPIEALTASAGWCAPSEVDYNVKFNGVADGLLDVPTINATRGGVFVMPEIDFSGLYGTAGTGDHFFSLTEAQVIAGAPKTFIEVDCPTPTESRLGVTGIGIIANLLAVRGYPEYTREFVRGSMVGLEIFRDSINIAAMVAGSVANDLSAVKPWSDDLSVLSVVLPMAAMAAYDQRARGRLGKTATIEQVFPAWLLEQMRADWMRRNGISDFNLADSAIMRWFSERNIAAQFVLGWQDYYSSGTATMPGTNTAGGIDLFPATVKFLSYPVGTWVNAVNDVINLSTIYDSARLAVNQRIEVFAERGNAMIKRRSDSRVYTAAICPTGSTGAQRAVACA